MWKGALKAPFCYAQFVPDENLLQVRQNRRERFCITACGDPQGESQEETSDILHDYLQRL
jgi:hypothetical protein